MVFQFVLFHIFPDFGLLTSVLLTLHSDLWLWLRVTEWYPVEKEVKVQMIPTFQMIKLWDFQIYNGWKWYKFSINSNFKFCSFLGYKCDTPDMGSDNKVKFPVSPEITRRMTHVLLYTLLTTQYLIIKLAFWRWSYWTIGWCKSAKHTEARPGYIVMLSSHVVVWQVDFLLKVFKPTVDLADITHCEGHCGFE